MKFQFNATQETVTKVNSTTITFVTDKQMQVIHLALNLARSMEGRKLLSNHFPTYYYNDVTIDDLNQVANFFGQIKLAQIQLNNGLDVPVNVPLTRAL